MKKSGFIVLFLLLLCNPTSLLAQTEPEDVALAKDDFQDSFFESLKQKGIENYDKAIIVSGDGATVNIVGVNSTCTGSSTVSIN